MIRPNCVGMRIAAAVWVMAVTGAIVSIMCGGGETGKEEIYLDEASRSAEWHAGWSDATVSNDAVYLSGIVVTPADPASDREVALAFDRAFQQLGRTLEAAGAGMDDVVDITVYMVDVRKHLSALDKSRVKVMSPPYAASTVVEVTRLIPDGAIAEIRAVAHRQTSKRNMKVIK